MEFDLPKLIDIGINVVTIILSALVMYNRMSNRLNLLEQKFDILTGNGFITKDVAAAMERRLDTRIDDLKIAILNPKQGG
jgi:hypothetical protein